MQTGFQSQATFVFRYKNRMNGKAAADLLVRPMSVGRLRGKARCVDEVLRPGRAIFGASLRRFKPAAFPIGSGPGFIDEFSSCYA
jgi:hypothetical protein